MKDDWNIHIIGEKVEFIPYCCSHVPKYHCWLQDPFIQAMTMTDAVSLEEEYDSQKEWKIDHSRTIFIVLIRANEISDEASVPTAGDVNLSIKDGSDITSSIEKSPMECSSKIDDELSRMIGDVNLFYHNTDEGVEAEINIMIAESIYRGKGLAKEILKLIIHYGIQNKQVRKFIAKIDKSNNPSLQLFRR